MAPAKATKKFQAKHLKGVLKRRKEHAKSKQKIHMQSKRKRKTEGKGAEEKMSMEEFFDGGYEKMMDHDAGGAEEEEKEEEEEDMKEEGGDALSHAASMKKLKDTDPQFHKHLVENEPALLDFEDNDLEDLGSDDEKKGDLLTVGMIREWRTALQQNSLRALRRGVLAFRAAAHIDEDEKEYKYKINDPQAFHDLIMLMMEFVPQALHHHLAPGRKHDKLIVATESKKFKQLAPLIKSYTASLAHLLHSLGDAATLKHVLTSTERLVPYLLPFRKLLREFMTGLVQIWAANQEDGVRMAAFLIIRKIACDGDAGLRDACLKQTYAELVRQARHTTAHTMPAMHFLKNSAAELYGLDGKTSYQHGFQYVRQLAIHLRSAIAHKTSDSFKSVYNWQFAHSLDFWSVVVSLHGDASRGRTPLTSLIYPLVQVTLGAMQLNLTPAYFPLRFYLIRALLRISRHTGVYIPLGPFIYEVITSSELRRRSKNATLRPVDFPSHLHVSKQYLGTRVYADGIVEQVVELLGEFFVLWCTSISFPELVLPIQLMCKKHIKASKQVKLNRALGVLLEKVAANAAFIEKERAQVDFAPTDRRQVDAFLSTYDWATTPLGRYVQTQREVRAERARLLLGDKTHVEEEEGEEEED